MKQGLRVQSFARMAMVLLGSISDKEITLIFYTISGQIGTVMVFQTMSDIDERTLLGAAAWDQARGLLSIVERRSDVHDQSLIHVFGFDSRKMSP